MTPSWRHQQHRDETCNVVWLFLAPKYIVDAMMHMTKADIYGMQDQLCIHKHVCSILHCWPLYVPRIISSTCIFTCKENVRSNSVSRRPLDGMMISFDRKILLELWNIQYRIISRAINHHLDRIVYSTFLWPQTKWMSQTPWTEKGHWFWQCGYRDNGKASVNIDNNKDSLNIDKTFNSEALLNTVAI